GRVGRNDDVSRLDHRVFDLSRANIAHVELGGGALAIELPKDENRRVGNLIVEALGGGDNLQQRHLTTKRIDAGLLDGALHRHALAVKFLDQNADLRGLQVPRCKLLGQIAFDFLGGFTGGLDFANQRKVDGAGFGDLRYAR